MPGLDLRPTADRLRETLFNVLTAGIPDLLQNSIWADLYAGTGAVGIEALSRGARQVYFVESSRAAVALIRENLKSLEIMSGAEVIQSDVAKALRQLKTQNARLDFVFLDPPYSLQGNYGETLSFLGESNLLGGNTVVVAEHLKKYDPGEPFGRLSRYRKLVQGDAALSFYKPSG